MITAFIPARGGSKGLPGKNIKHFANKPLIIHSIEFALSSEYIDEIIVSTDDEKIAEISLKAGAKIIKRPEKYSHDTATTESAIEHYLNEYAKKPEIIVLLQPTSPHRPQGSLDFALKYFKKNKFDSLLSITPTHKFFWRLKEDKTTYAEYNYLDRPMRQNIKNEDIRYIENGSLYIFTTSNFLKTRNRLGGKIGYVEWSEDYQYEIDTQLDFEILEKLFLSKVLK
tara:strand:- start:1857 stop:2534 length:678 start_codon:yes stop_codon:yes gene_type:complete